MFSRRRDVGGWAGAGPAGRDELRAQRAAAVQFDRRAAQSTGALHGGLAGCPAYDIQAGPRRINAGADGIDQPPEPPARSRGPSSDRSAPRPRLQRLAAGIARSTKGVTAAAPTTAPVIPPMATTVPPPPANRRLVVRSTVIRTTDEPFPVSRAAASDSFEVAELALAGRVANGPYGHADEARAFAPLSVS